MSDQGDWNDRKRTATAHVLLSAGLHLEFNFSVLVQQNLFTNFIAYLCWFADRE